ncbi:MAG: DUF6282 family protein [Bryobacteraceae bacterium]
MRSFFLLMVSLAGVHARDLRGVVDLHVHSDPDVVPRSIDAIDAAKLAHSRGMRALLLKNHYEPTASLAYLVRKEVPGIEAFGGIVLNRAVGGINLAAVERLPKVKGGYARVVWMPTFDAENQVRDSKQDRPFVRVSRNGKLLPEVTQVIAAIARAKLALATGHSAPAEVLLLIEEARRQGVERILVTHAMLAPVRMTIPQMRQAARQGAMIEFVYNALIGPQKMFAPADYAKAMRAIGVDHCVMSSDLGQAGNPLHPDGFQAFLEAMAAAGFTSAELDRMSKTNPARLLGLP